MNCPEKEKSDCAPVTWCEVMAAAEWRVRLLFVLTLLIPACLACWFVWQQRAMVLEEARNGAKRSVIALHEHAAKVMESHLLLLRHVDGLTAGRTAFQIREDGQLKQMLTQATALTGHISVVGVADANGHLLLGSSRDSNIGFSVLDQDYFIVQRRGHDGIFVSQPFMNPISGIRQFVISMSRKNRNGEFDGIVYTGVSIDYLTNFWRQFAPSKGYLVPMIRDDGTILARYPALKNPDRLASNGPFLTRIRQSPSGIYTAVSLVDGVERTNAYTKVGDLPIYLSFSIETEAALQRWKQESLPTILVTVVAALVLLALWLVVMRQRYKQHVAVRRWRQTMDDLNAETIRRERVEDALRQASKMEAIGQLAQVITHDFNNLLAVIKGKLELIQALQMRGQHRDAERQAYGAVQAADKATALTQRLLAFSRHQAPSPIVTDVNKLVLSLRELVEASVGPSSVVVIQSTQEKCYSLCDPGQLETSLLNLSVNSRDAMPGGGTIIIRIGAEFLELPSERELALRQADYVVVSVSDTGHGMTKDVLEKALDRFFTTKPVGQGTGLGLSMVQGFAEQSGGTLRIASTPGCGTTVRLYLPRCPKPEEGPEAPHPFSAPHARPD